MRRSGSARHRGIGVRRWPACSSARPRCSWGCAPVRSLAASTPSRRSSPRCRHLRRIRLVVRLLAGGRSRRVDGGGAHGRAVRRLRRAGPPRSSATTPMASLKKKLRKIRADVRKGDAAETARTVFQNRSWSSITGRTARVAHADRPRSSTSSRWSAPSGSERSRRTVPRTRRETLGQLQYDIAKDLILEGAKIAADPGGPRPRCRTGRASCRRSS